jgi:hypothetical protein
MGLGNPPLPVPSVFVGCSGELDFSAPAQVSAFSAAPSVPPAANELTVSWIPPGGDYGAAHLFYRPWLDGAGSGYPGYTTQAPAWPADLAEAQNPANGWTEVVVAAGSNAAALTHSERTVLSVFVCAEDAVGNISDVSTAPRFRTANYRLGDLGELDAGGSYGPNFDGVVDGVYDLPVLSLVYGATSADPEWIPQVDIGPTDDATPAGVPLPDGVIDFEELLLFAQDFPAVNKSGETLTLGPRGKAGSLSVSSGTPLWAERNGIQRRVELPLQVDGNDGELKGLHLEFSFDPSQLEFAGVRRSSATQRAGEPLLFLHRSDPRNGRLVLDLVVLGKGATLSGDGVFAFVEFDLKSQLGGSLEVVGADARDRNGKKLALDSSLLRSDSLASAPMSYRLLPNTPNPFNPSTLISLETPRGGPASLRIYDVSGRLVDVLFDGQLPAGYHDFRWDGRDQRGRSVASGTYLYELRAPETRFVKKMMLLK